MSKFSSPSAHLLARAVVSTALLVATMVLWAPVASAGPGYQPDSVKSSISTSAELPIGVAVDQASQNIYVAELSAGLFQFMPGRVEQLNSSGVPTANSPFGTGGQDLFAAVAVNPVTSGIYAYQVEGSTPVGQIGTSKMSTFSSSGVLGTSFTPTNSGAGTLAVDPSGRVFFPNSTNANVQVFSSTGTLEDTITCGGCLGGAFSKPSSVAFDSTGKLYVVDRANGGRVIKFAPSAGTYAYQSVLQAGTGAVAVGVDSSNDDVLVGDLVGSSYHVVAYNSAGTQFDDFASGFVSPASIEAATGQLAVNATTHDVYLTDPGGKRVLVFERIASIPAPTASAEAPSPVGQLSATLKATVNAKGHGLTGACHFEYTTQADFGVNGYANATSAPCPSLDVNGGNASVSAQVGGLSPNTSYRYRVLLSTNGGTGEDDEGFTTLAALPPEVTTGTASSIDQTSATLGGSVNPKGGPISDCHFEYTSEAAFQEKGFTGAISKTCTSIPSGTTASSVLAKASGLTAASSYRFRLTSTNNSGTTKAVEKAFTTLADTCETKPALCPVTPSGPTTQPTSPLPPSTSPTTTTPVVKKPLKCRKGFRKKRVRGKLRCVKVKKSRSHRRSP